MVHSYFVKQRMQQSNINYQAWLSGLYVLRAIQVAVQDKHKIDYYNKPIEELNYNSSLYKHTKGKVDVAEQNRNSFNTWAKVIKPKGV